MHDVEKTTKQWATEVAQLRQRIAELETAETERKRTEEELKKTEECYRELADSIADVFFAMDKDLRYTYWNKASENLTGVEAKDAIGKSLYELFPEVQGIRTDELYREVLKTEQRKSVVQEYRLGDKSFVFEISAYPSREGLSVFVKDITERKQTEEALRDSEERYRAIFEQAADSIVLVDAETGALVEFNDRAHENLGYTRKAFEKLKISDFEVIESAEEVAKHIEKITKEGADTFETKHRTKGGEIRDILVSSKTISTRGRYFSQGIWRDITERKQAEEALQESEKRYRNIFETIPVSIIVLDKDGQMVDINPYHLTQIAKGQTPKGDFIGKNIVTHPTIVKSGLSETYKRVLEGKSFDRKDVYFPRLTTGADGYFNVRGVPLLKDDEVIGAVVIQEDITERKQTEKALRDSEERYRAIFEQSPFGVGISSLDGTVVATNKAMEVMTGYSGAEFKKIRLIDTYEDVKERKALLKATSRYGNVVDFPARLKRKDGTVYDALLNISRINLGGKVFFHAICQDITERKRTEEALRESEGRYRTLVDNIDLGINLIDADHNILMANAFMGKSFNKPVSDLVGKKCFREFEKRDAVCPHCPGVRTMATGKPAEVETKGVRDDGSRLDVRLQAFPVTGQDGTTTAFIEIAEDITERKQMEVALQHTNETLQAILEFAPLPIFTLDLEGTVGSIWNTAAEQILGWKKEEVVGKPYPAVPPGKEEEFINNVRLGFKGMRGMEARRQRRDGSPIDYSIYTAPLRDSQGHVNFIVGILLDITEQKQAEKALKESEEKYRSLVESSDDSIYLVDSNCNYLFMNSRYLSRLGLKSSEIIGRAYRAFHSPEETKDFAQKVEKVFKTGKPLSYEYKSQRDTRYFIRTLSPVKPSENGKPAAITVISKDINKLKQAEEALREREAFNFALFHYNPIETIVVDRDGSVIGFNLAKEKSGDRLPYVGDLMYKDYAGKHEIAMRAELMACIKSGKVKAFPERRYGDRYLSITISPFSQGALIISEDITERNRAKELLQRERDTLSAILKKAPYGVVFLDKDGKVLFTNIEFTNVTGYTIADVPTLKHWFHLSYPNKKYRDIVIKTWERDVAQSDGDKTFQKTFNRAFFRTFTMTCKDGTIKEIEFRPTVLEDGSAIVMLADITERKRMHELLEAAATQWRTTFDAISDAVCLLDQKGRIKRCNNAMLRMIGKSFSEVIDRACWEVMHAVSKPPKGCTIALMQKTRHRETEVVARDSCWFNVALDPLLDEDGNLIGGVHIMSDITERMKAEEELHSSREELRNLTTYLESVREQERTVIAREIHDELAQSLTALKMDVSWLDNRLPRDQKSLLDKTKSMNSLIDTTIQTVKRISAELRPGILDDLGLVAAIEWQAEEFRDRTGIACHVTVDPEDITLDQNRSTAVFRIFQETLTNVARHARATKVMVSLKKKARKLTLRVRDNGIGITEEQIADSKSFGLIGMRERVYPWGGNVSVTGTPGKGTRVLVSVPLENEKGEK